MRSRRRSRAQVTVLLDPEARDRAEAAAPRARMPMNAWVERAIVDLAWRELRAEHHAEGAALREMARGTS
jgi:hypothetical protein